MNDPWERYRRLTGKMEITIEGNKYVILAKLQDKLRFIEIREGIEKKTMSMNDLFLWGKDILARSYPSVEPDVLEQLLTQNSRQFFDELSIGFGFFTRADIERMYLPAEEKKNKTDDKAGV